MNIIVSLHGSHSILAPTRFYTRGGGLLFGLPKLRFYRIVRNVGNHGFRRVQNCSCKELAAKVAEEKEAEAKKLADVEAAAKAARAKVAAAKYAAVRKAVTEAAAAQYAAAMAERGLKPPSRNDDDGVPGSNQDPWKDYFEMMHNSQGFDIKCTPDDNSREATIVPFKVTEEGSADVRKMCEGCILLYNQRNDQNYEYHDGGVENVAFTRTPDYSLYYITFRASQGVDSNKPVIFLGRHVVCHLTSEEEKRGALERMPLFCNKRDVALSDWEQRKDQPCTLGCCKRYNIYAGTSSTYRKYVCDSWKKNGAPFSHPLGHKEEQATYPQAQDAMSR
ncbi:OLC1v1002534C1 [Oldenlandia corymbosa var. corymbosa]|uniref:OLC1v1002534C1 n=1 Tax=Oldenlandia corymbosa var. corymbosa TaxID=529605 RepID=A0AAV1D8K8_OLDCO|nr:OLC1v1002534C1 [Oldenlandia corymbosa var. corymbosa]